MADEKIVVVCVGQDCYKMNNASGVITLIAFTGEDLLADVNKGDVVTIEIKRAENK